ncbi:MAG: DUF4190 domain-containing protein [Verrucomicrobiota bacterium]
MQIFIQHKGQQCGPFPLEHVRSGLADGTYQLSEMAWYEGASGWLPLSTVPGIGDNPPEGTHPSAARTSGLAIWSLVLGILALFSAGLTAIPAVICGHLALGRIKRSAGAQSGGGLAIAGLVTGYLGFCVLGIAMLAGLTAPLVIRQRKKADQTEAINNARQIGLALFEFQSEYGSYPNDATAKAVADATNTEQITGNTANDRFRQLIHAQFTQSERLFYAHIPGVHKPDGLIDGDNAVAPGECGFAYIGNSETTDKTIRPLAIIPLVRGTTRFDPQPFDGKAVILWTDNSVRSLPIDRKSGRVMLDGKNLLDPSHPVWGGQPPLIALPE